jgi:hypothetical protein
VAQPHLGLFLGSRGPESLSPWPPQPYYAWHIEAAQEYSGYLLSPGCLLQSSLAVGQPEAGGDKPGDILNSQQTELEQLPVTPFSITSFLTCGRPWPHAEEGSFYPPPIQNASVFTKH